MTRWVVGLIGLAIPGAVAAWVALRLAGRLAPIRVGLLHSRTGPMKISEESIVEAEVLALEEINARGGLLGGRPVEWVIADGQFDVVWRSGKTVRPIEFPYSRPRSRWEDLLDELNRGWNRRANPVPVGPASKPATTPSAAPAPPSDPPPDGKRATRSVVPVRRASPPSGASGSGAVPAARRDARSRYQASPKRILLHDAPKRRRTRAALGGPHLPPLRTG